MGMLGEREHPLTRRAPGEYVNGRWREGAETISTFRASIQPAKKDDYDQLQSLSEGRRVESAVRIYTRTELNVAGADTHNGDQVEYQGDQYLVTFRSNWNMGMRGVNHFRFLAVRQKAASEEGS